MDLNHYIQSGIIESYVLGIATASEVEELHHMRRIYPALNLEIMAVERRIERTALKEAVLPSPYLKERIFQRINWRDEIPPPPGDDHSRYTFINIQSKDGQHITVHRWWRLFFIITFLLSKVCLFFAIYYFLKYQQAQEKKEEEKQRLHTEQVSSLK
ncbi:hypothetical protein [Chitinophaga rhizophila]|uniref:Uncharacterized protein n=1 Tax=Chitinophaga rhizophila TaxID=2866212 RepID=A0ABS7GHJ8_9BACT|nr:hypothetical protein [Chitinophaga rhizophila]MBW8686249.1 hypothetical protein [Chitinophaga rhizophila]